MTRKPITNMSSRHNHKLIIRGKDLGGSLLEEKMGGTGKAVQTKKKHLN